MSAAKQEDRLVQLDVQRVHLADHKVARFVVEIPKDHTVDDCLQPHYWAHHARRFQAARTLITAIWDDNSQIAEFFVANCGSNFASVKLVSYTDFDAAEPVQVETKYVVEWISTQDKHGVIRAGDRSLIKSGFHSKKDAEKFIEEMK